jgi:hypothetical protein
LLPGSEHAIPPEHRRVIQRMEFGPKHLVNSEYFRDRICPSGDPGFVFLGSRTLLPECRIEEVGLAAAFQPVLANCVIGVGLFQGLGFILQSSALELAKKTGLGILADAQLLALTPAFACLSRPLRPGSGTKREYRAGVSTQGEVLSYRVLVASRNSAR